MCTHQQRNPILCFPTSGNKELSKSKIFGERTKCMLYKEAVCKMLPVKGFKNSLTYSY